MVNKTPGKATRAPSQNAGTDTQPRLELVDYEPKRGAAKMVGGAYNPYERPKASGDTVRMAKPRVDLRQLSKWIKIKKEVDALRTDGDLAADASSKR